MKAGPRTPGWQRDVIWSAGTILVLAALVTAAAVAWSRLSDAQTAQPILTTLLRATLLPGAEDGADEPALAVRAESGIRPGAPFEALPGSGVRIDPSEAPAFDVEAALDRIGGVWSSTLIDDGRAALAAAIEDPSLARQLERVVNGPARGLVEAELAEELMASGLADGSRMANWPLQAQQSPGEPVQPIVGVFVFFGAELLQGLSERQIGELVVARLAELTIDEGADAARDTITNVNLTARYEQGLAQARAALHELFAAVASGRAAELETRLAEARAVQAGEPPSQPGLSGLLPASELAGLPPEAANQRILEALAERTWRDGPSALDGLLENDPRAPRLDAARPVLGSLTRVAHARAKRLAWSAGVLAVVAAGLVAALAQGAGRLSRPGIALLLAAAPGAGVAWTLQRAAVDAAGAALPAGARAEGALGALRGLARHLLGALSPEAAQDALRVHLVLAAIGAALLLAALLALLAGALRPRRRGYL